MQHRYAFLDGLRGLAAISVAFGHAAWSKSSGYFFPNGALAVDFFFCLSGFVLAHAYDGKLAGGMGFAAFMKKRLIRLYPMIFIGVLLGTAVAVGLNPGSVDAILAFGAASLVMFPLGVLRGTDLYPVNGPMWSLFFELAACVGYWLAARYLPRRLWPAVAGLAGAALVFWIFRMGDITHIGIEGRGSFVAGFARCAYPFMLGVLLYRLPRAPSVPSALAGAALIAVLLSGMPANPALHTALAIVLLPAIVWIGAGVKESRLTPLWDALGRLSYPLYLVHYPIVQALNVPLAGLPMFVRATLELAVACVVAWGLLVVYDEPVRGWLSARRTSAPVVA